MNSKLCEMFGIDLPIFAFSHCRDVVAEVSKAGGMGVLGVARSTPEQVEEELRWIDEHVEGKPYGVDILMPTTYETKGVDLEASQQSLPDEHVQFVRKMLDDAGIPRLPDDEVDAIAARNMDSVNLTPEESAVMLDIAFKHPIKLIVNALGSPPRALVDRAHAQGIKIAALAGSAKHAIRHRDAGCDFVIAAGNEAGGHTGAVTSMILWPQIVDAVPDLPVLGAGGVGRGRQLAAALALGCEGVWCGSIWLKTVQSEVTPEIKARMFEAEAKDSVWTKALTGKTARMLRSGYTDAWEAPDAPRPLPPFRQRYLWEIEARGRLERARRNDYLIYPVGQLVGDFKEETSVRNVVMDMLNELVETKERLDNVIG
ncbi:nitronate monooxygenase [Rhizorhabdus wittichii]|uniref:Nitronate monooxygenase n=2 Tax=Rhizorhabdus wittichii TaxID=160791 RepID=A0A975CZN0_9SPHN|nr:nitronate monooxygenase [Rhizorhabdus wittichii]